MRKGAILTSVLKKEQAVRTDGALESGALLLLPIIGLVLLGAISAGCGPPT